jgi:hypothetical protein
MSKKIIIRTLQLVASFVPIKYLFLIYRIARRKRILLTIIPILRRLQVTQ